MFVVVFVVLFVVVFVVPVAVPVAVAVAVGYLLVVVAVAAFGQLINSLSINKEGNNQQQTTALANYHGQPSTAIPS